MTSLSAGTYPAIANHNPEIIKKIRVYTEEQNFAEDRFEFQMLYGVRRDLQASPPTAGYCVRIYIPFSRKQFLWFYTSAR